MIRKTINLARLGLLTLLTLLALVMCVGTIRGGQGEWTDWELGETRRLRMYQSFRGTTVTYLTVGDPSVPDIRWFGLGFGFARDRMYTPAVNAFSRTLYAVFCPWWFGIVVCGTYPAIAFVRGPLRRHHRRKRGHCVRLGFDLRIKSTTARMVVATLVGTILIPIGYFPGGFFGFYWLHDVHGAPMWVVIPIVLVVSFSPIIYITLWLFWRLAPGDHGGPLWRRRRRRLRERGLCMNCAYDLTGNESGVCPECGTEVEE